MRCLTTLGDVKRIGVVFTLKHLQAYKSSFLGSRMPEEMELTSFVCRTDVRGKISLF